MNKKFIIILGIVIIIISLGIYFQNERNSNIVAPEESATEADKITN